MSEHRAHVRWQNDGAPFTYDTFSRDHALAFGSGQSVSASSAVEYKGTPSHVNPEELLVSALASCHMLTFLSIATRKRLEVISYEDHAVGTLGKNEDGRIAVTDVVLRPRIAFREGTVVTEETLAKMHELAHANCFIASSTRCRVRVEPLIG